MFDGPSMSEAVEGNTMIEIHDSTLEQVDMAGDGLVATLSAFVHRSPGVPGRSRGSVWSQTVRLELQGGSHGGVDSPIWVVDGHVALGGETYDNTIPWPLAHVGPVRIEFEGSEGEHIVLVGQGLKVSLLKDAKYVEEFPGEQAL